MAAYAALVSLMHIIDNLKTHCRPPIILHKEQAYILTQKVTFLQEFLRVYNPNLDYSKEADPLESRIARAAYAAEDAIESHILDQFADDGEEEMSFDGLYKALEKVIEDMVLIEKEAKEMETSRVQNQLHIESTHWDSSRSSFTWIKPSKMVGADDLFSQLIDRLTSGPSERQIIPIVGMAGLGKTTLALHVYQHRLIKKHFDIRAWVTLSQEYSIQRILIQLLAQLIEKPNEVLGEFQLGDMLYQHLYNKKYVIVMDDMWGIESWDRVKMYLPNQKNGSRVVITTRLTSLDRIFNYSNSIEVKPLDEHNSWDLLSKIVFGEKGCCPLELKGIGKKIVKSCIGLPLSIVVVGRLLAESEQSIESWKYVQENLNAIVNLQDDGLCLQTLYISYKQLPVHVKSCFLYMGIYCEDRVIRTSKLIRLWVAEGFVKPISGKSLENVARACLKDLTDRSLILVHKLGSTGSIKECKVHYLFRDFCIREAIKEGFYIVYPGREIKYRVSRSVMSRTIPEIEEIDALSSAPLARSLILDVDVDRESLPDILRLLRIVGSNIGSDQFLDNVHQLVNSRFFAVTARDSELPSLIWQFWNLKALIVSQFNYEGFTAPNDIWYMSQIRHICINNLYLPDAPDVQDGIILENLQTLATIINFTCSEQVVKRVPNIRKLKIVYREGVDERFSLTNLDCLHKLESLNCIFNESMCQMSYPRSLKKLNLEVHISQCWQDILDKIGALPLLEKLSLHKGTFEGGWETTEGQFPNLKYLSLNWCEGLQVWTSEDFHFPRLEKLHLYGLDDLEEIPIDIGYIPTLTLIVLERCSDCIVQSAKTILEEQEENGREDVLVQVMLSEDNDPSLESLSAPKFHVTLLQF